MNTKVYTQLFRVVREQQGVSRFSFFLSAVLSLSLLLEPPLEAYDLSRTSSSLKSRGPVTVALVPFVEQWNKDYGHLLDRLHKDLASRSHLRVLGKDETKLILDYYLRYAQRAESGGTAHAKIVEARQALLAGDDRGAQSFLDAAEKAIHSRMAQGGSNEGLYICHLLKAKLHHAHGDERAVGEDYAQVVRLYPQLDFDPLLYSHWERKALGEAKKNLEQESKGTLSVTSSPSGSEVFLNGVHQGITPMTLADLPMGKHVLEIKTVNYQPFLRSIELSQSGIQKIRATLAAGGHFEEKGSHPVIRPSLHRTDEAISQLIATLGYHMGVDRIVLVSDHLQNGRSSLVYRITDSDVGAVRRQAEVGLNSTDPAASGAYLAEVLERQLREDVLANPQSANPSVGSLSLHEKGRRPFYKRPLFWVMTGVAAGTGGVLAAVLGAGSAAATGGILVGF